MFKNAKVISHETGSSLGVACPITLALALALGACIEAETASSDAGHAVEDAATPLRTLERYALFGQMPIENRVLDPQFALLDGSGWGAYGNAGKITLVRNFRVHTPLQQPVLEVQKKTTTMWTVAMGWVKSKPGPLNAGLWVGRDLDATDAQLSKVTVGLLGLYRNQGVQTAALQVDTNAEPTQMDGIEWHFFSAQLEDGPLGWSYLVVTDEANPKLYLSSPIVVTADTTMTWSMSHGPMRKAEMRAVTEQERAALKQHKVRVSAPTAGDENRK